MPTSYTTSIETINKRKMILAECVTPQSLSEMELKFGYSKSLLRYSMSTLMEGGHIEFAGKKQDHNNRWLQLYKTTGKSYNPEMPSEKIIEPKIEEKLPHYITKVSSNDYQPTRRERRTHSAWARPEGGMYL
jgi:hypothetical protein